MANIITFTKVNAPYGWMGNMSPYPIQYKEEVYRTAEALFQALRFNDVEIIEKIRTNRSPMGAKFVAKANSNKMIVSPTSEEDVRNMRLVLSLKVQQHPQLAAALRETGDAIIIEDCCSRPGGRNLFWGAALQGKKWVGENMMGKLWMEIRDKS